MRALLSVAYTTLAFSALSIAAPLSAAATAVMPADPVVDADDKIRCRRIEVTGSHIRREKVCKTVGEWRRLADRGNEVARQQWEGGLICSGGPCRGNEP